MASSTDRTVPAQPGEPLNEWDAAEKLFADPEVIANLDPSSANKLFFVAIRRIMFEVWGQLPPSRGYEPLLVKHGIPVAAARGLSELAVRHGKRRARESKWYRPVFAAIRFLGGRERQRRAVLSRAKVLLNACKETSIFPEIFDKAGLMESEFIDLLRLAVNEGRIETKRITEIAASLVPHLSAAQGPKISAPSAAYEFILEGRDDFEKSGPFCSDDSLAEATRLEFGLEHFDGRPARRRVKARKRVKTN
jgi:hypothetical protein